LKAAGGEEAFAALQEGAALNEVFAAAAQTSFQAVAVLPVILIFVFGGLWVFEKSKRN